MPATKPTPRRRTRWPNSASPRAQSQHLFDLGQALARAHYESRNQLLARANTTLSQLRHLVLALLALLFLFGAGAGAAGLPRLGSFRCSVKLVESQSLAERHEKLASLGMLAAGVAHEIRNPLTAIKAAVFIQQKKFAPGSPEAADAALVQREILRLERIVTEFLQFARPAEPDLATMSGPISLCRKSSAAGPGAGQEKHPAFARRIHALCPSMSMANKSNKSSSTWCKTPPRASGATARSLCARRPDRKSLGQRGNRRGDSGSGRHRRRASRRRWRSGCSIRFSPPSRREPAWDCPSPRALCRSTAGPCSTRRKSTTAPPSASFCPRAA